jgi:hypothetical protein
MGNSRRPRPHPRPERGVLPLGAAWTWAKKQLGFCRVTQDGDDEGILRLDRLPWPDEASEIRALLGIRASGARHKKGVPARTFVFMRGAAAPIAPPPWRPRGRHALVVWSNWRYERGSSQRPEQYPTASHFGEQGPPSGKYSRSIWEPINKSWPMANAAEPLRPVRPVAPLEPP